jgi:hypothetical protein
MSYIIQFQEPTKRITGKERRSKLLDPKSDLYKILSPWYQLIMSKYGDSVKGQYMDFHIEVLKPNEDNVDDFLDRVSQLEGSPLNLNDPNTFYFFGNAFSIRTPYIENYGETHITIAYFIKKPENINDLIKLINIPSDIPSDTD